MNENANISTDALLELNDRYLLFYIDNRIYSIPLVLVLDIIQIQKITYLPTLPIYVKGIVNLRGKVVPVIDVRVKFCLPDREYDDKTCIIVLDIHDMHIGLIVDRVHEVATLPSDKMAVPPTVGDPSMRYLTSVTEIGGNAVLNIDFERFFQDDLDTVMFQ